MYAYEYDDAGNLVTKRARSAQGPIAVEYTYTNDGLLSTAVCGGGTTTVSNTWDAMGNRVGLTVGSDQYTFLYNPIAGVPAVLVEAGPDKTYYYFRDPNGVLIARFDTDPENEDPWRYYHYDELGSTRLLTDEDGEVTDEYAYDAYGNTITHLGTTQDNPYQWVGALGYYTHYQAPEFRLIQLGFRFYDPEIGRFTQQDPIGDGLNWYAYCGGNPLGGVDPWGLAPKCWCAQGTTDVPRVTIFFDPGERGNWRNRDPFNISQAMGTHAWIAIDNQTFGYWPDRDRAEGGDVERYQVSSPDPHSGQRDAWSVAIPRRGRERQLLRLRTIIYQDYTIGAPERWSWFSYSCAGWVHDVLQRAGLVPWGPDWGWTPRDIVMESARHWGVPVRKPRR